MDPITRARINDSIRDLLAGLLEREIQDPRVQGVTVTAVEVTPDLAFAKVFFSVLGDAERQRTAEKGLQHVAGFFRRQISRQIRLRQAPQLHFEFDHSLEHGERIETLLREWHEERKPGDPETGPGGSAGESS